MVATQKDMTISLKKHYGDFHVVDKGSGIVRFSGRFFERKFVAAGSFTADDNLLRR